jgi:hydroxymethylglutaryl-CoA lyase
VPNLRGAERALDGGIDELEVVVSVSEVHNLRNLQMTVDASIEQIAAVVGRAAEAGTPVEAILATSFGCPYVIDVEPGAVASLTERLRDVGVASFSFADTTGMATPPTVVALIEALDQVALPVDEIALHLHNTRGTGLANLVVAAQRGVRKYDASIGGLGGCPFSPGATGNVPTEDVVHLLDALGACTGVDLDALVAIALELETTIGRSLPGQVMRSGPWNRRHGSPHPGSS